jgi:hypothetical protein
LLHPANPFGFEACRDLLNAYPKDGWTPSLRTVKTFNQTFHNAMLQAVDVAAPTIPKARVNA